jgi:phosphopantothenoylcysteine decarboxylase/phosphopantothenate--cysteine ligase
MNNQKVELNNSLSDKTIILGVTGGIAAYKAAELVSSLVKMGNQVHVILTKAALDFITPLTLQTLSKNPVLVDEHAAEQDSYVPHIDLAAKADLFVIAPATANTIAKIATGIADNLLTSTILATKAPVLIAPAMNVNMYENPITQKNISFLKGMGYHFIEPEEGMLACGIAGKGRLPAVSVILDEIKTLLSPKKDFLGKRVMVTAGGTREAIDPVRYIGNRSSGKMGFAIAKEAQRRGAHVTLIAGFTTAPVPEGVELIRVESAEQMAEEVLQAFPKTDIIIKAAAVADFKPKLQQKSKIKKSGQDLSIELCPTTDILKQLSKIKDQQILVGFAAETDQVTVYAKKKLQEKNVDLLVANDVSKADAGFEVDTNIVSILHRDGQVENLPLLSKDQIATLVLDRVAALPRFSVQVKES